VSATSRPARLAAVTPDAYRAPLRQRSYRFSVRSPTTDYGPFVPTDAVMALPDARYGVSRKLRVGKGDVFSLLRFPRLLRGGRARAPERLVAAFPDVQRVLGKQATVTTDGGGGGALSFGQLPFVALSLVLLSSLLLVGALLPPAVIAQTPVSPAVFGRIRQPLALAAVAILIPVAVGSLAALLS
jgi:hypothetical protein